jgi:mevalonate kinase
MGFFPPTGGRDRSWITQMRRLGREEEELEDIVSHLSIYLTGLDKLCRETAAQLKEQIRIAEGAEKALIVQTEKVVKAVEKAESNQRA